MEVAERRVGRQRSIFLNLDDHVIRKRHERLHIGSDFLHVQAGRHRFRLERGETLHRESHVVRGGALGAAAGPGALAPWS